MHALQKNYSALPDGVPRGSSPWRESRGRSPLDAGGKKYILLLSILVLALCLQGCGIFSSGPTYRGGSGQGRPYTVRGETYYPLLSGENFVEEGVASWYGKDFHGKTTANGECYDMYGMTAAHKILPFNTKVKVTNLANGRSVVVRINDRGPFVADRVIDLTNTAAAQIGMLGPGTARVRVESVGGVANVRNGDIMGNFYVQVGAFSREDNARRLVAKFKAQGQGARTYFAEDVYLWRVQVGPYPSVNAAEGARGGLSVGYPGNFVVAE